MNPFRKSPKALKPRDRKRWVCPQQAWDQLQYLVENDENVIILGVEGSGKSSLLNMFFSPRYCQEAAKENKLIFTADLSDSEDGNDLCTYLIDRLLEAAKEYLPDAEMQHLNRVLDQDREKTPKQTFVDLCERLERREYTTLLVMDGFENFVLTASINQHDMLRSLLDKDIMRCVVASNYDLEKTSLPLGSQGSLYLQKFQQKLTLQGFSQEEAVSFLQKMLAGDAIQFNKDQINFLMDHTGGIPGLLEMSASHMYDMVQSRGGVAPKTLQEILYDASRVTLQRWCKFFTPEYEEVVESIRPCLPIPAASVTFTIPHSNQQNRTAATRLCERGLWRKIDDDTHRFNSLLLQLFFCNREQLPHPQAEPVSVSTIPAVSAPIPGMSGASAPVVIHTATINVTGNITQAQQIINNQFVAMGNTRELLDMITSADAGREGLANAMHQWLTGKLPTDGLQEVPRLAGMSDAEYDALCDHAFAQQYSDQVVDTIVANEDDELADISEREQLTLDQRFQEARAVTRPELTDAILEKVSARTGFYLKLSVVVEDALSVLKLMQGKNQDGMDCSPQLILYGKAVEQQLKDSFFPLFHQEGQLQTYQIRVEGRGMVPFSEVEEEGTFIGNYMHAIRDNVSQLGTLCVQQGLLRNGVPLSADQWQNFWRQLHRSINHARILRNLSAHTSRNKCPQWEDVDKIAQLSFGGGDGSSIFECCSVGNDLNISLFGNGVLDIDAGKALEGTEEIFCCTRLTPHNGVHGHLERQGALVKISPSMAQQFRNANPNVDVAPQKKFRVRLIEYKLQHGQLFFSAQLLAPL